MRSALKEGRPKKVVLTALLKKMRAFFPEEIRGFGAALYHRLAAPGFAPFHRKVALEVTDHLKSGWVLDVGTGPGLLLAEIARRNQRLKLVGLDLSREMLRIASTGARGDNVGSARFVRANVKRLPFSDGAFDLVLSTASLHHWRDPEAGIRECLRVTRPRGSCWIYDLRTDVGCRAHAKNIPGGRLRSGLLGIVFRFHGVRPREFSKDKVAEWLDGSDVQVELKQTYLKLVMRGASSHVPCELNVAAI